MKLLVVFYLILSIPMAVHADLVSIQAPSTPKDSAHVGANPGVPDGREGGDTVYDAFIIAALPFQDSGNTCDNINDYDEVCPYTGSQSPDVVYAFTAPYDQVVYIDLCESGYDTKLFIYENAVTPGNPYACNDDSDECALLYRSHLMNVPLYGGNTYYIVIDGYGSDCGDYILQLPTCPWPPPCELECPAGGVSEGEPPLYDEYVDSHNPGCASSPPQFQLIDNTTICAVSGWYQVQGSSYRDSDWFTCFADEGGLITATAVAEQDLYLFVTLPTDCNSVGVVYSATCECEIPGTVEFVHPVGTEAWLFCAPTTFTGPVSEFDYILTVDGIELSQQSPADQLSWGGMKNLFR